MALLLVTICRLQNGDYMMASIIQMYLPFAPNNPNDTYTLIAFMIIIGKIVVEMVMAVGGFGMLAGLTNRVMDAVEKAEEIRRQIEHTRAPCAIAGEVSMSDVSIATPDGKRTLIHGLNFSAGKGQSVVIMGPSGGFGL